MRKIKVSKYQSKKIIKKLKDGAIKKPAAFLICNRFDHNSLIVTLKSGKVAPFYLNHSRSSDWVREAHKKSWSTIRPDESYRITYKFVLEKE